MKLKGKTAIVTGGARRIGKAICIALAKQGMNIVVDYRKSKKDARQTVKEIQALGVRAIAVKADISKESQVERLFRSALKEFGRVDVLVNNASVFERAFFSALPEKAWDKTIEVNLKGVFLCSQNAARVMSAQGGKIINLADWSHEHPIRSYAAYGVSKGGVVALTKSMALELAPKILVNAIAAGAVLAPESYGSFDRKHILHRVPLRRYGTPEEIAHAAVFLLENDFCTGSVITVDGGRCLV